ncbi:CD276 antigen-like [Salarias fasciatus]|uniref:CD276 antigen-like n=1 Tax=Salarias fasciatus TaxID=181472 RepID=UPI001176F8A2|nr:CD276 antigen-like [Salarias fasciatus]
MNRSDSLFWVFFLLLLDVWIHADGVPEVVAPCEKVFVRPGDVAVLPCLLNPRQDLTFYTVEWSRRDGPDQVDYIHIYRRGIQEATGPTRTSLFLDQLAQGNISLAVLNVTLADGGTYCCTVPRLSGTSASVELVVDPNYSRPSTTFPPPTSTVQVFTVAPTDAAGSGSEVRSFAPTAAAFSFFIILILALTVVSITLSKSPRNKEYVKEPCEDPLTAAPLNGHVCV